MKEYIKPELEVVDFTVESITDLNYGTTSNGEDDSGL